jgi:hypothetical protein
MQFAASGDTFVANADRNEWISDSREWKTFWSFASSSSFPPKMGLS